MKETANGYPGSGALGFLFLAPLALGVCALPVSPGCSPDESMPRQEDLFLTVVLHARYVESSVSIDRSGRSRFNPDYTEWMLSTPSVCRTLPDEDLREIESAFSTLADDPGDMWSEEPDLPVLIIGYGPNSDRRKVFFVKPNGQQPPEREQAVRSVLAALHRTYGDRFVRELREAGLLPLFDGAPEKN
jgi:hypothetical protein